MKNIETTTHAYTYTRDINSLGNLIEVIESTLKVQGPHVVLHCLMHAFLSRADCLRDIEDLPAEGMRIEIARRILLEAMEKLENYIGEDIYSNHQKWP